jgi:hypothetical protein
MTIYLYVKQHSITKLFYFGKTTRNNPHKYPGSGTRWTSHYKKHGKEFIVTLEVFPFEDQKEATSFALQFSEYWDIVNSPYWANLIPEDAKGGGWAKHIRNEAELETLRQIAIGTTMITHKETGVNRRVKQNLADNLISIGEYTNYIENPKTTQKRKALITGAVFIYNVETQIQKRVQPSEAEILVSSGLWLYGYNQENKSKYKNNSIICNNISGQVKRIPSANAKELVLSGDWHYGRK